MNQILKLTKIVVCFSFIATGCIQDNFWKSGVSNGRFDGSLLEYMDAPGHSYDWDSTVLMVRHAGEAMVRCSREMIWTTRKSRSSVRRTIPSAAICWKTTSNGWRTWTRHGAPRC